MSIHLCELAAQGVHAWKEGHVDEAQKIFERLCDLDTGSTLWPLWLARLQLADEGKERNALAICDSALSRHPHCAELLVVRARTHLLIGNHAIARHDLELCQRLGGLSQSASEEFKQACKEVGLEPSSAARLGTGTSSFDVTSKPPPAHPGQDLPKHPATEVLPAAISNAGQHPPENKQRRKDAAAKVHTALQSEKQGLFRQAFQQCREALELEPDLPDAVLCTARMQLANGCTSRVAKLLHKEHPKVLKQKPHCVEAYAILAAACESTGDWDDAVAHLEQSVKLAAVQATGSVKPSLDVLQGRLARAYFHAGERDSAAPLAQRVLESNPNQREACEVACPLLLDRGDFNTALALLIRCLIHHRSDPSKILSDLVCTAMRRCSVNQLLLVLAPDGGVPEPDQQSSIAEVIAYMGLILKENSVMVEACQHYHKAVLFSPTNGSLCLNLMHTYALRRDDLRALSFGARYFASLGCSAAAGQRINACVHGTEVDVEQCDKVSISLHDFANETSFYDTMAVGFVMLKLLYLAHPHRELVDMRELDEGVPQKELQWQQRLAEVDVEQAPSSSRVATLLDGRWLFAMEGEESAKVAEAAVDSSTGAERHRDVLSSLCDVLDESRKGHDLHKTPVRNEHAYFSCIREIVKRQWSSPIDRSVPLVRMFAVGDSHVLSSAWQTLDLTVTGQDSSCQHVVVPRLVTGAKLWHLQPKSKFYTKFAFWEQISSLPKGAPILLILGEIDCRDGVLKAVQKGRYSSVEAALSSLVELYVRLVQEVRARLPTSPIFVHPVPNVLPETRFLTIVFNRLLAEPVARSGFAKANAKVLEFASVFDKGDPPAEMDALALSKLKLLPELQLDGTHMSPNYVESHLGPALRQVY